jgi:ribose transport system ATP-binding protein
VSFEIHRGEIVGLAGLMGSGRTETLRAIFGADELRSGRLYLRGRSGPARINSPADAVRHGIALVPEDRKTQGLLLSLSVRANITLGVLPDVADRLGRISFAREERLATAIAGDLIRTRSLEQPVGELSGGNQQKVLLARWLCRDADVLLVDEPSRGIDVGSRAEVHRLLRAQAAAGKALVVASSDLDELFALADRILVFSAGRVAAELGPDAWSADAVMAAATGGHGRSTPAVPA